MSTFAQQHGRAIQCQHCGTTHDGTTRALELHPSAPHVRPFASTHIHRDDRPNSWFFSVGGYHSGYVYTEELARATAEREAERLGIEVVK